MGPTNPSRQYAADDEERFRLLVKNSPDMVFRRSLGGVFEEVSAAGREDRRDVGGVLGASG